MTEIDTSAIALRLIEDRIAATEADMAADASEDDRKTSEGSDLWEYYVNMPYETAATIRDAFRALAGEGKP